MTRFIAVLAACLLAVSSALGAPVLRPTVTVDGAVIHLGDLFVDAGARAEDPVSAAPAPGMRTIFAADWLAAMAREHGLAWTPSSAFDQAVVQRASRTIGADQVVRELLSEIGTRQRIDDAELQLDNAAVRLVVAADAPDTMAFDSLSIDQRSGRISAFVTAPAGDPNAVRQRLTGRLVYHLDLPVLNRALAPGAPIAAADLDMIKVRRDRVGPDVAMDPAQIVGKTPRRPLRAGEPVRLGDVQRPVLVHKGDLVTIMLETQSLQLTAQGKALDDGAQNALVRVENTKSSRVVDAAVTGPGVVAVVLPGGAATVARTAAR